MVSSTNGPYKVQMKSFRRYLCTQNFRIGRLRLCRRPDLKFFYYVAMKKPLRDGTFRYCIRLINTKICLLIAYRKIPNIDIRNHLRGLIFGGLIFGGRGLYLEGILCWYLSIKTLKIKQQR